MATQYELYKERHARGEYKYDPDAPKVCNKCLETKKCRDFRRTKNSKSGVSGPCRVCASVRNKERYRENLEASRAERRLNAARYRERKKEQNQNRGLDGVICSYCCEAPATDWDHIVPLSKGGFDAPSNLIPSCGPCNRSKGDQYLLDFVAQQPA